MCNPLLNASWKYIHEQEHEEITLFVNLVICDQDEERDECLDRILFCVKTEGKW